MIDAETLELIADLIRRYPALSTDDLARRFPDVHSRRFGEAIVSLVEEGLPIGSSSARGYFYCRTPEDAREARGEIIGRIVNLRKRLDALDAALRAAGLDEAAGEPLPFDPPLTSTRSSGKVAA